MIDFNAYYKQLPSPIKHMIHIRGMTKRKEGVREDMLIVYYLEANYDKTRSTVKELTDSHPCKKCYGRGYIGFKLSNDREERTPILCRCVFKLLAGKKTINIKWEDNYETIREDKDKERT